MSLTSILADHPRLLDSVRELNLKPRLAGASGAHRTAADWQRPILVPPVANGASAAPLIGTAFDYLARLAAVRANPMSSVHRRRFLAESALVKLRSEGPDCFRVASLEVEQLVGAIREDFDCSLRLLGRAGLCREGTHGSVRAGSRIRTACGCPRGRRILEPPFPLLARI